MKTHVVYFDNTRRLKDNYKEFIPKQTDASSIRMRGRLPYSATNGEETVYFIVPNDNATNIQGMRANKVSSMGNFNDTVMNEILHQTRMSEILERDSDA